jgi:hypothetical protein
MSAWYEIIVRGPEDALRGFVAGYEAAQKKKEGAVFGHDLDLEPSRFSQHLQELFAAGSHHLVFAGLRLKDALVAGLRDWGPNAGLRLEGVHEVLGARLRFSGEAFSQEVASAIKQKLLIGLPPGVEGEGIEEHEEIDQAARGPKLYAPEHAYTYTVKGAFTGPLPGVIEMQRRARNLPFVRVGPLELETRAVEEPEHTRE